MLTYGVEGYAPYRHLTKEDNSMAREGEKLEFKVLEFNKESKRILVSHKAIHDDKARSAKEAEFAEKDKENESTAKAVKKLKENQEKSTLGDNSALAALKSEMEAGSKESE